MTLDYLRVQQQKVAAFASGMHARLGAASGVSWLDLTSRLDKTLGENTNGSPERETVQGGDFPHLDGSGGRTAVVNKPGRVSVL